MTVVTVFSNNKWSFLSKELLSPFDHMLKKMLQQAPSQKEQILWDPENVLQKMKEWIKIKMTDKFVGVFSFQLEQCDLFPKQYWFSGDRTGFYSRTVKGRFQMLIQQRSRKKIWELVLAPQLNAGDMKHITLCSPNNCLESPRIQISHDKWEVFSRALVRWAERRRKCLGPGFRSPGWELQSWTCRPMESRDLVSYASLLLCKWMGTGVTDQVRWKQPEKIGDGAKWSYY